MNIHLISPTELTIEDMDDEEFHVTSANPVLYFNALSMWVASLSRCTFSVLAVYGDRFDVDPDTIVMTMRWDFLEEPTRFKQIEMDIYWPALSPKRLKAVQRVAQHCTIHNTIHDCVDVATTVRIEAE